uniref:CUB domain-containing protein n=1 Tax=Panagrolaimus sp. JU765 TaxID=591449 RepID=A0AC34Q717_9BILA
MSNTPTNCLFGKIDNGTWVFSNYDTINGYKNNQHCYAKLLSVDGYHYSFQIEEFFLSNGDNLTLETSDSFTSFKIHSNDVAPGVSPPRMKSYYLSNSNYHQYVHEPISEGHVIFEMALDDSVVKKGYRFEIFFQDSLDYSTAVYYDNLTNYMGRYIILTI